MVQKLIYLNLGSNIRILAPHNTTQVRHHVHYDLSTCRVCFDKNTMLTRQYLRRLWYDPYPLHAWSRSLSFFFGALVCDLVTWTVVSWFGHTRIARRVCQSHWQF